MPSPFLYFPGDRFSPAELTAACLDGHLVGLGEGYVPADLVETVVLRAASLAAILGDTLAATHESAAWVLGVLDDPPARHTVQRAVDRRIHHVLDRRLVYRDSLIEPDDLLLSAGVLVSTPARTLADLARSGDAASNELAISWTQRDHRVASEALDWLARHRGVPRKVAARRILTRARKPEAQEDVTR
jgi:hypothetical protein